MINFHVQFYEKYLLCIFTGIITFGSYKMLNFKI
jgi:hypothetical protein